MSWRVVPGSVCLGDLGGTVRVGYFSNKELSRRELPGAELSAWGYCSGRNSPGVTLKSDKNIRMAYLKQSYFFNF